MDNTPVSPIEELSYEQFKGHTFSQEKTFNLTTNLDVILPNNPNRVQWIIINEGNSDARIGNDPTITLASGWLLPANGGIISMIYKDDGESVGYAVYARCSVSPNYIRIREVIRL